MGRKSARAGQFLLFCAAGLMIVTAASCLQSKRHVTSEEEVPRAPVSAAGKSSPPASVHWGEAQRLYDRGDFEGSLRESRYALLLSGDKPPGDMALYHMALVYAHPGNPKKDYDQCRLFLQRLLHDFPRSPLAREAKIWMETLLENEKLRKIIERTKQVDLEVEGKKKEKAR